MRENKKQCPGSLDVTRITDKINFWRVVEPNFSIKIVSINRITSREDKKRISDT